MLKMKINISDEVKTRIPCVALGVINYIIKVEKSTPALLEYFEKTINEIENKYEMGDIANMPHINEAREAYKALGKSPSQYRNAAEAMLRRIVKGNGLYKINNVVEINNLISVSSGYSIGSYDHAKLNGDIELRRSPAGEDYQGIGKAEVNIENLPVLYDAKGPFGNPTSDSRRAMIQNGEREVINFIYAFNQDKVDLEQWLEKYQEILRKYTNASNISVEIV